MPPLPNKYEMAEKFNLKTYWAFQQALFEIGFHGYFESA